jgi:O-antigen/teichoic acid export membrane protein
MEREALVKIIHILTLFSLGILVIWQDLGIRFLVYAYILAALIGLTVALFLLRKKFIGFWQNLDLNFCKDVLKKAWPFALFVIFAGVYYYLDTVILSIFRTDQEVGWYNAAYKIILFLIGIVGLYMSALTPAVARYYQKSSIALQGLINGSVRWLIMMIVPLAVGGTLLAKPIIYLFYGSQFDGAVIAFQILIWSMAVLSVSLIYGRSALFCDKEKKYAFVLASGLGINIVLNLVFIPFWGLIGAAIATVIAQSVVLICVYYLFNEITKVGFFGKYAIKPAIASGLMVLFYRAECGIINNSRSNVLFIFYAFNKRY